MIGREGRSYVGFFIIVYLFGLVEPQCLVADCIVCQTFNSNITIHNSCAVCRNGYDRILDTSRSDREVASYICKDSFNYSWIIIFVITILLIGIALAIFYVIQRHLYATEMQNIDLQRQPHNTDLTTIPTTISSPIKKYIDTDIQTSTERMNIDCPDLKESDLVFSLTDRASENQFSFANNDNVPIRSSKLLRSSYPHMEMDVGPELSKIREEYEETYLSPQRQAQLFAKEQELSIKEEQLRKKELELRQFDHAKENFKNRINLEIIEPRLLFTSSKKNREQPVKQKVEKNIFKVSLREETLIQQALDHPEIDSKTTEIEPIQIPDHKKTDLESKATNFSKTAKKFRTIRSPLRGPLTERKDNVEFIVRNDKESKVKIDTNWQGYRMKNDLCIPSVLSPKNHIKLPQRTPIYRATSSYSSGSYKSSPSSNKTRRNLYHIESRAIRIVGNEFTPMKQHYNSNSDVSICSLGQYYSAIDGSQPRSPTRSYF